MNHNEQDIADSKHYAEQLWIYGPKPAELPPQFRSEIDHKAGIAHGRQAERDALDGFYKEAIKTLHESRDNTISVEKKRDKLLEENKRLRSALEFYSHGWIEEEVSTKRVRGKTWKPVFSRREDHGQRAREALATAAKEGV